eukprot:tig00000808_g4417.t1
MTAAKQIYDLLMKPDLEMVRRHHIEQLRSPAATEPELARASARFVKALIVSPQTTQGELDEHEVVEALCAAAKAESEEGEERSDLRRAAVHALQRAAADALCEYVARFGGTMAGGLVQWREVRAALLAAVDPVAERRKPSALVRLLAALRVALGALSQGAGGAPGNSRELYAAVEAARRSGEGTRRWRRRRRACCRPPSSPTSPVPASASPRGRTARPRRLLLLRPARVRRELLGAPPTPDPAPGPHAGKAGEGGRGAKAARRERDETPSPPGNAASGSGGEAAAAPPALAAPAPAPGSGAEDVLAEAQALLGALRACAPDAVRGEAPAHNIPARVAAFVLRKLVGTERMEWEAPLLQELEFFARRGVPIPPVAAPADPRPGLPRVNRATLTKEFRGAMERSLEALLAALRAARADADDLRRQLTAARGLHEALEAEARAAQRRAAEAEAEARAGRGGLRDESLEGQRAMSVLRTLHEAKGCGPVSARAEICPALGIPHAALGRRSSCGPPPASSCPRRGSREGRPRTARRRGRGLGEKRRRSGSRSPPPGHSDAAAASSTPSRGSARPCAGRWRSCGGGGAAACGAAEESERLALAQERTAAERGELEEARAARERAEAKKRAAEAARDEAEAARREAAREAARLKEEAGAAAARRGRRRGG